jgi:hypothetical protein
VRSSGNVGCPDILLDLRLGRKGALVPLLNGLDPLLHIRILLRPLDLGDFSTLALLATHKSFRQWHLLQEHPVHVGGSTANKSHEDEHPVHTLGV